MTTSVKYMAIFALFALLLVPLAAADVNNVEIKVIDKNGDEIEDADITLYNSTDDAECTDTTDKDGSAECDADDDDTDDEYRLKVTHNDYQTIDEDGLGLDDDDKILVVMRPKNNFDLEVEVTDQDNDGIKGVTVTVECTDDSWDKGDFENGDVEGLADYDYDDYDGGILLPDGSKYRAFDYDEEDETGSDGIAKFKDLEFNCVYKITLEKNGYPDTTYTLDDWDKAEDLTNNDAVEVELTAPGTAQFTAIVRDQESGDLIEGATVRVALNTGGGEENEETNANGEAKFTLDTPNCYDIAVTATGYSTDSQTALCMDNDDIITSPFFITSQNNEPTANAGDDLFILVGDTATLNGSKSSDPDGDTLTYVWEDSLGTTIPDGVSPSAMFDVAGDHIITLTVSDGDLTSTDTVTVNVGSPEDCGDALCTITERETNSCPTDCPVCGDLVCGAGEADAISELYCPGDCGISLSIKTTNTSPLVAGNTTTLLVVDPNTGKPVLGVNLTVTQPNGSVFLVKPVMGRADFGFFEAGTYTVAISSAAYVNSEAVIEVGSTGADLGWMLWAVLIIVIVIATLFLIRFLNTRGKRTRGGKGYRAKKYRRGKSTLSSV